MPEKAAEEYTLLSNGYLVDDTGTARPPWACANALLRDYYDTEWGQHITGEQAHFERLCLESFQAGLSWELVLRRRNALRKAFASFIPDAVAAYKETDVAQILATEGMIRNERKIRAVIKNARACIALRDDPDYPGGLEELITAFAPIAATEDHTEPESYAHLSEIPTQSTHSHALAKELKKKGFSFVGPTSMHALFEAIGLTNYIIAPGHPVQQSGDAAHENGVGTTTKTGTTTETDTTIKTGTATDA